MIINTITCHDVYNFGASLQAYALQQFLEQKGYTVRIINYKPDYLNFQYKFSIFVHPYSPFKHYTDKSLLILYLYSLKRFISSIPSWRRKLAFDRFTKQYLNLTEKYSSYDELVNNPPIADTYIVGSDQVWNSITMLNGTDPAFYLQFADNSKNRIAYAASFGATSISELHTKQITEYLSSLNAISVRESTGVDIINKIGLSATHVCDPVFLLSEVEWRDYLSIKIRPEKYVLIYNLTSINESLISDAKRTAKKLGIKLYSVSPIFIKEADASFRNIGPNEFVSFIFNASYVFTNSFHATAFSIISKREFCTYNYHSTSNSSRMQSLLQELNLLERLNIDDIDKTLSNPINYDLIDPLIKHMCDNGKQWLLDKIENK